MPRALILPAYAGSTASEVRNEGAINGFGRIGRSVSAFWIARRPELVAINDVFDHNALRYFSIMTRNGRLRAPCGSKVMS